MFIARRLVALSGEVFKQFFSLLTTVLSVGNDIHYTDSGLIEIIEYSTLVLVHGHTFHTGM